MISGAIGKIGDSYTIDVKIFSVETGATEDPTCSGKHFRSGNSGYG